MKRLSIKSLNLPLFLIRDGDNKMLDIFTTREIASGIYLVLIISFDNIYFRTNEYIPIFVYAD